MILCVSAASAADVDGQLLSENSATDLIDDVDEISDSVDIKDTKLSQGENTEIYADEPGDDGGDSDVEDPIDTTVESEDQEFKYGEDIKIPVSVKDNESNNIGITKDNLNVSNGTDEINFTLDNESNIILNKLNVGSYVINIKFLGNATYKAAEKSINLAITQSNTEINASDLKVKVGSDILIPMTITDENNNTITYKKSDINVFIGEELVNFTISSSKIKLLNVTDIGDYTVTIKFLGNDNYLASQKSIALSILANNTMNTTNDTFKVNNHTQNVTIPIQVTNTNITTTYDEETEKNVTNVNVTNKTLTKEDLKLLLTYADGDENVTIEITDFELNGDVGNYTINFVTEHLDHSKLNIIYANGTLDEVNKTVTLIGSIFAKIIVDGDCIVAADYQDGKFIFKLVDENGNPLANTTILLRGVNFYSFNNGSSIHPSKNFTSDANGLIVIENINMNSGYDFSSFIYNFTSLAAGKYNLTFRSEVDSLILENTTEITVNPVKVKIVASNYKEEIGSGVKYIFKLVNAATNKAIKLTAMQFKVKIGGKYTTFNATTNMTGQASFNINLAAGTYPVTMVTNSANVVKTTLNKTITVIKKTGVLSANNRTIYYGSDATAIIRFKDKKTGKAISSGIVKVRVYTTSKKYTDLAFLTNKTGYVKFNMALATGKHKLVISSGDNNYTASSITRYVTIKKATGKFSAPKISTYYKSGKIYSIKLTNTKNKNAIYGAGVNIKVYISKNRFYNYTGTTDGNGKVNLKVNYKPGTYKVVVSANDKGYTAKSVTGKIKVTKHPLKYTLNSLKIKKGNALKVKVISKKNKKALSGVKVKIRVYTGKKFKTYTRKTNKKGIASLKITQKVGKHKIVILPYATSYYSGKKTTTLKVTKK